MIQDPRGGRVEEVAERGRNMRKRGDPMGRLYMTDAH